MTKESLHQKILREIVEEKRKDPSVVAISVFGSVARGEEKEDSDIDLEIVSTEEKGWRIFQKEREGISVTYEMWPEQKFLERVRQYPFLSYCYVKEKIVYDPKQILQGVVNQLRIYFSKHPEVVQFWEDKYKEIREAKSRRVSISPIDVYDEAEIEFSGSHSVTRDFLRSL